MCMSSSTVQRTSTVRFTDTALSWCFRLVAPLQFFLSISIPTTLLLYNTWSYLRCRWYHRFSILRFFYHERIHPHHIALHLDDIFSTLLLFSRFQTHPSALIFHFPDTNSTPP